MKPMSPGPEHSRESFNRTGLTLPCAHNKAGQPARPESCHRCWVETAHERGRATNGIPVKSRVYSKRCDGYIAWVVESPAGSRHEFFAWRNALLYAVESTHKQRQRVGYLTSKPLY